MQLFFLINKGFVECCPDFSLMVNFVHSHLFLAKISHLNLRQLILNLILTDFL